MTARRWIWVLGAAVVALVIALVVVLVTRDDSDDETSPTTTTSTTSAPSTTGAGTTSPATTSRPTTSSTLPPLTNDTEAYARYLFAAWQQNNQQAAAQVASAEAVQQMFSQAYSPQSPYTFGTCGAAAGSVYCTMTGANGATITMTVRNLTGGLPIQVVQVSRS